MSIFLTIWGIIIYAKYTEEYSFKYTPTYEACSAERVLASTCQNMCCAYREFWRVLASTCSGEHAYGLS